MPVKEVAASVCVCACVWRTLHINQVFQSHNSSPARRFPQNVGNTGVLQPCKMSDWNGKWEDVGFQLICEGCLRHTVSKGLLPPGHCSAKRRDR